MGAFCKNRCDGIKKLSVLMLVLFAASVKADTTTEMSKTPSVTSALSAATELASVPETAPDESEFDPQLSVQSPSSSTCELCTCTGTTMDCSMRNLHAFLLKTEHVKITRLDLGRNSLESLDASMFLGVPNLRYLSVMENYITTVDANAFDGLAALEKLEMTGNAVSSMPSTVLMKQTSLQRLYMRRNRLTDITFLSQIRNCSLDTVQLTTNALSRLSVRAFGRCTLLRELWLDENKISDIDEDAFDGLVHLTTLDLSSNRLTEIPPMALHSLRALRILDLSRNQLVTIDGGLFETLTSLRSLFLPFNWLRDIPAGVFSTCVSLRRVDLSENLIEFIDEEAFTSSPIQTLRHQQVTHPRCTSLTNTTANVAVKHLDLSNNHLRKIPSGSFLAFPNMEELNLENNLINTFGPDLVCVAAVLKDRLLFSGNRLVCTCGALYDAFRLAERVAPDFQPICLHSGEPWVVLKRRRCRESSAAADAAAAAKARAAALVPPELPTPPQAADNGLHAAIVAPILAVAFVSSLAAMAVSVFRRYRRATFEVPRSDPSEVRMTMYARAPSSSAFSTSASATTTTDVSRL